MSRSFFGPPTRPGFGTGLSGYLSCFSLYYVFWYFAGASWPIRARGAQHLVAPRCVVEQLPEKKNNKTQPDIDTVSSSMHWGLGDQREVWRRRRDRLLRLQRLSQT